MTGAVPHPLPGPASRPAHDPLPRGVHADYDRDLGLLRVCFVGDLFVEDLEAAVTRTLAHPDFRPGMSTLWDLTQATVAGLSAGDLRRLHSYVLLRKAQRGAGKMAVVVAHVVDYGLARMFELMCEDLPTRIAVFRQVVTAEAWLLADAEV